MSVFEVRNLEFSYAPGDAPVLRVPEWRLAAKEKVFLFGASGSGKTTLLEILAGVLTPTQGEVRFLSQPWSSLGASARDRLRADHMGYIFQSFNLIPYLNVRENIAMPLHLSARRRERCKDAEAEIQRLAASLGVAPLLDKRVTQLSVGQQQRVAAARALIGAPEVILADEPTSALDMDHRESFLKLLFEEADRQATTVLFVSHDRTIQHLFDRAVGIGEFKGGAL